ncbi:chaplin [Streptomyces luteogriseus]|uniref:chaplin n=1 Tax=Streptomyces luteogriseus TaxID=68233 RepID=UPI002E381416|nr:chaplin [Streptomyces luteogriseus]
METRVPATDLSFTHAHTCDCRGRPGLRRPAGLRRYGERERRPVGVAADSPGFLSGNVIRIPIDINANACGNSINVIGLLNPAFGNEWTIKDRRTGRKTPPPAAVVRTHPADAAPAPAS